MPVIQALNPKTSSHQHAYRITVWAGRESSAGCRAEVIVYGATVGGAVQRALKAFRAGVGKKGHFSDWTIDVEPIRGNEEIVAYKPSGEVEQAI